MFVLSRLALGTALALFTLATPFTPALADQVRPGKPIGVQSAPPAAVMRTPPTATMRPRIAIPRVDRGAIEARNMARRMTDEEIVRRRNMTGQIKTLSFIESRIVPQMPGARYIGSTFDPESSIYTLKFMRDSSVIWVNVDGRTARIIR